MSIRKSIRNAILTNPAAFWMWQRSLDLLFAVLGEDRACKFWIKNKYKKVFGRPVDLENPQTLTEKIQWMKLNIRDPFATMLVDKYACREYWKQFGEEGLIPLLYKTEDWRDIKLENMPDVPCIVKWNSGSGSFMIVRDKNKVDYKELQKLCKLWLKEAFSKRSQEWQYKNVKPCIIIEKLLMDKNGKIPNDYKLHFINGKLAFTYCSVDREGKNYRSIYDADWNLLPFIWVPKGTEKQSCNDPIERPASYERMLEIGTKIAQHFNKYIRVDFYDVDGKLYYGEITLHHGGGFDLFRPDEYDYKYGQMLDLNYYNKVE